MAIKKIAITTGGGDAPGLNGVIRSVTLAASKRGWQCIGIRDGFDGMLYSDQYEDGGLIALDADAVRGIAHTGGTILGTTNRGNPFAYTPNKDRPSEVAGEGIDLSDQILAGFERNKIDALVAIGGDGTMAIAHKVSQLGIKVVGVPKTIDNDLDGTVATFGFDSAVSYATDAIGRLHTTASSHHRVMIAEVMGRNAGWIALEAGLAGSADVILIPEIPFSVAAVAAKIEERNQSKKRFSIISIAEGAFPVGGEASYKLAGGIEKLGGIGDWLAQQLRPLISNQVRTVVLGHLLRGGAPTSRDRLLAVRFGSAAVRALDAGNYNVMVALLPPTVHPIPLADATHRMKDVPLDCDMILTARDLGTCLGDSMG